MKYPLSALLLLASIELGEAFTTSIRPSIDWNGRTVQLHAKVKKGASNNNKKNAGASSSTGFGAAPSARKTSGPRIQDDYAAFPALEPGVKDTLLAFDGNKDAPASDLPTEMYARLAEIYGFRSFNYLDGSSNECIPEEDLTMSFEDLLNSAGSTTKDPSPLPSDFSDLLKPSVSSDINELIAAATGEDLKETCPPEILPIDKLPPFEKFQVLHVDPLVLLVEDFFTHAECDRYIEVSENPPKNFDSPLQSRSKTVGKDSVAESQRTSTTWFHHYKGVPELISKAARLFGIDSIDLFEEPQTVRYRRSEKFTWHLDALAPGGEPIAKAGQRAATLLVYLTDLAEEEGGATMFRDLGGSDGPLKVQPKKGSALVFFPAATGIPTAPLDIRTLHCGEAVAEDSTQDKWIAQLWLREKPYSPTAPPGNTHWAATEAITEYCTGD